MSRGRKGTWPQALASFFLPILVILFARWALIEPYVIPSGSMIPNLLIHDHILVKKSSYGIRLPFSDHWLWRWSNPKPGDIIVFRFPDNPAIFYVKRLIGLPGDQITVNDGKIKVNGKDWTLESIPVPDGEDPDFAYFRERNDHGSHTVRFFNERAAEDVTTREWTVPEGEYFFMGDNRDQSSDGRVWGFVPEDNLIGRAWFVWLSCDEMLESAKFVCNPTKLRWNRFFQSVEP